MQFNTDSAPKGLQPFEVQVGDIYRNTRGILLVVVAIINSQAQLLMVDAKSGNIVGVQKYGTHYLLELRFVGRTANLPEVIEIDWEDPR